jgi:arylsulfatase A-like enzyme
LGCKVLPYEEGARVPLIIVDPRVKTGKKIVMTSSLTGNVDIAATILDLADIDIPSVYDGTSLLPVLKNTKLQVRETLPIIQVWGPEATHCLTVMDDRHKYIYWFYEDAEMNLFPTEELFDLHKDPYELENIAGKTEYQSQLTRMRKIYDRQLEHWKTEGVRYNGYEEYGVLFDRNKP